MKKSLLIAIMLGMLVGPTIVFGQAADTSYWRNDFDGSIVFNQSAFSSNWTGGGINSLGLTATVAFNADYKKGRHSWDNQVGLLFGFTDVSGQGFRKNLDRILIDTKYGYDLSSKWSAYAGVNFLTQFANGFRFEEDPATGQEEAFLISKFMAPGFLTTSFGFEYKPADYFKVRLSPFAPRFTFVTDQTIIQNVPENYGVEPGETVRTEIAAAQIQAEFKKDIFKNVNLFWRYLLFANYETISEPRTIDHRLDLLIKGTVNDWLEVSLGGILLFDVDQDQDLQWSQIFGIGLYYKWQNYESE